MDIELALKIFSALGGTAFLGSILRYVYNAHMSQKNSRLELVTERNLKIQSEMASIVESIDGAAKVVFLQVHNGGGEIKVGTRYYSSAIYEVNRSSMKPVLNHWNNQVIDEDYTRMLVKMLKSDDQTILNLTKDMPKSILKDVYTSEGIKMTKVLHVYTYVPKVFKFFNIGNEKKRITWYMSIIFEKERELTATDRNTIRIAKNSIKTIFEEQYKYE